jgi:hypothetical protein
VEGTATTDSSGQFSYTPNVISQGVVPLRARTSTEAADGTKTVSRWFMLAFVYSTDPDGTTAQGHRADLEDYETQVQDSQSVYEQALVTAEATFQTAWQNAEALYHTTLENAQTTLDGLLAGAESLWQTQFASARSVYLFALAAAEATFQTELANFTGDTTSFALPEFVWPDPPSLAAPPWTGQSQFHVDGPRYTGRQYDFDQDTAYQDELAHLENLFNQAVQAAETAYKNALQAADGIRNQDVSAAHGEYQTAEQAAREL